MQITRILCRPGAAVLLPLFGFVLGGCGGILDVKYPGRIPAEQIDDPTLAAVLTQSVIGDLECAYNNYNAASSVHSDEYESTNSNVPGTSWGERSISADEDDYAVGPCEFLAYVSFGLHVPMQTARFQAEDIYKRLNGWTDAQVSGRALLLATVRAYGGYPYVFFGETYCSIAFDGGPEVTPAASLAIAEQRFADAISLAQAAGSSDLVNMASVGMARTKMDLKKWAEAATFAAQVAAGYL